MLCRNKYDKNYRSLAILILSTSLFLIPQNHLVGQVASQDESTVISDVSAVQPNSAPATTPPSHGESHATCPCETPKTLFGNGDNAEIQLGGWASFGYHDGPGNGLFNNHPNRFNPHQIWFFAERAACLDACQLDWGFRIDAIYGVDGADTQAFSNPTGTWDFQNGLDHGQFSWALPQAYVELGFNDTSIKVGHFYTLIGYEVVPAPDNFFYSHAITMYNSEPFTHTGVLMERTLGDHIKAYAGYTLGWDTGFDQSNNGSSFLGGVCLAFSEHATVTWISTAGNFGARSAGQNGYSQSVVVDLQLTENLNYVVQSDLLRVTNTGEDNIGLNQYLILDVNCWLALGARAEWWKADDVTGYAPFGSAVGPGSHSYYETTVGANIILSESVRIRPEYRYDWSPALGYDEPTFGIDVVITP